MMQECKKVVRKTKLFMLEIFVLELINESNATLLTLESIIMEIASDQ